LQSLAGTYILPGADRQLFDGHRDWRVYGSMQPQARGPKVVS
jgi:hypothetical protein